MKRNRNRILALMLALLLLSGCGGPVQPVDPLGSISRPEQSQPLETPDPLPEPDPMPDPEPPAVPEDPVEEPPADVSLPEQPEPEPEPNAVTSPTPEDAPKPVDPEEAVISDAAYTCTLAISCAALLDNLEELEEGKELLVPEDGWILEPTAVTFYEGESVFNVLQRTCKQEKIHLEFEDTPLYNSAYVEGIHNLYEFDCGDLSGWMYQVNGWFPNYGCSRYQLQDGDVVVWEYTCDLGADVNGYASATQES